MRNIACALRNGYRNGWAVCLFVGFASISFGQAEGESKIEPGLSVTFTALGGDKATDMALLPNVALYVVSGQPPTPFMPGGKFFADWTGYITVDMRDTYTFQAALNGSLKLQINGAPVLETSAKGTQTAPSNPVRLAKGTNAFKVH